MGDAAVRLCVLCQVPAGVQRAPPGTKDALSPAREGVLEAGSITDGELGARTLLLPRAQREQCHSPAQVKTGSMTLIQGVPEWVGDPAGFTCGTAPSTHQHHQHPAALAGRAADSTAITLLTLLQPFWDCPAGPSDPCPDPHFPISSDPWGPVLPGAQQILQKAPWGAGDATLHHHIPHPSTPSAVQGEARPSCRLLHRCSVPLLGVQELGATGS